MSLVITLLCLLGVGLAVIVVYCGLATAAAIFEHIMARYQDDTEEGR